mgnify:CR=1 FL=1
MMMPFVESAVVLGRTSKSAVKINTLTVPGFMRSAEQSLLDKQFACFYYSKLSTF